jgi:DNA-binding response OmpR family regulator
LSRHRLNGVSLISWLAAQRNCGIIVVSGRGDEVERVVGITSLGVGAFIMRTIIVKSLA